MPHKEETAVETQRLSAHDLRRALDNAHSEVRRSWRSSAIGLCRRNHARLDGDRRSFGARDTWEGGWQQLLAYCRCPAGFILVIIGRQQLFTENTLSPVVLVLDERRHGFSTLRLWQSLFLFRVLQAH